MPPDVEEVTNCYFALFEKPNDEFPWDQRVPFDSAVQEVISEMPSADVVAALSGEGRPLLIFIEKGIAIGVEVTEEGVRTTYSGSLEGGRLSRTVKRIDERNRLKTLRFEHERLPGGVIIHTAESRYDVDLQDQMHSVLRPFSTASAATPSS